MYFLAQRDDRKEKEKNELEKMVENKASVCIKRQRFYAKEYSIWWDLEDVRPYRVFLSQNT